MSLVCLLVLFGALHATAGAALAHALLLRSDPAPDVILRRSPIQIHLWFSESLNGSASRIIVWDRNRRDLVRGPARIVPGESRQLTADLRPLGPGSYLVLWTSVSSEDGHVLRGSYLFSVIRRGPGPSLAGVGLGNPGQSFPDAAGLIAILAHWLELLAAVLWVGSMAFSAFVLAGLRRRLGPTGQADELAGTRRWVRRSLLTLLPASTIVLLLQIYQLAGNDWGAALTRSTFSEEFSGQFGQLWVGRQVLAILALTATLGVFERLGVRLFRGSVERVAVAIGGVYLAVLAASGHAAAAEIGTVAGSHLFSLSVLVDWFHLLADALWLGGQFFIVLVLIPILRAAQVGLDEDGLFLDVLARFSPVAYASVFLFTVSGGFNGAVHIPSWYAFFHSVYGWTLIVKIALIGLMMLTSAFTVYGLRPRIRQLRASVGHHPESDALDLSRRLMQLLRRFLGVNPVLGAGVLLATSVMFSYPVPPGLSPPGPSSYTVRGNGLSVNVSIKPDRSGPNLITVSVRDTHGRLVQQAHVVILTTMLDMIMGTGLASLTPAGPGRYQGSTDLGMGGHWRFQVLVYQPSGLTRLFVDVRVGT